MRLLFSVLKHFQNGVTPNSRLYKMKEAELGDFLRFIEKKGFIQPLHKSSQKLGSHSNHEYGTTPQGISFLEEHKHFEIEMPVDEEEIPHWIRFEGKVYRPSSYARVSLIDSRETAALIDYKQWTKNMEIAIEAITKRGGSCILNVADQATEAEISIVEAELGVAIPESFKRVLLGYSKRVHFYWHVPESEACTLNNEESKQTIQAGGLFDDGLWDLDKLADYNAMREDLDYLDDDYKQHWVHSLIFARDGMGSYYAIDLKYNIGEVIFLAHDGHYHGWRLGQDFEAFFDNWIKVGCAGSFVTDFIAFSTQETPYLSEKSAHSNAMKEWFASTC